MTKTPQASSRSLARKARSEQVLSRLSFSLPKHLEPLPDASELLALPVEQQLDRALCLLVVALKAEGLEPEIVASLIEGFQLQQAFTEDEANFLAAEKVDAEDNAQMGWRLESAWLLWWSLGLVDELSSPAQQVAMTDVVAVIQNQDRSQLLAAAKPRALDALLDEADLYLRLHAVIGMWEGRKRAVPGKLEPSVILERHVALQWLLAQPAADWEGLY